MTRETKVGLLVGMGVILLIGIIISDHLSVVNNQTPAIEPLTGFAEQAQESINSLVEPAPGNDAGQSSPSQSMARRGGTSVLQRVDPVPTPREMERPRWEHSVQLATPQPQTDLRDLPRAYAVEASPMGTPQAAPAVAPEPQPNFAPTPRVVPTLTLGRDMPERGMLASATDAGMSSFEGTNLAAVAMEHTDAALAEASRQAAAESASASASGGSSGGGSGGTSGVGGTEFIHYVKEGETLYAIAEKFYGNGDYWRTIAQHNPGRVQPNGQVRPNVRLIIPNRAGLAAQQLGPDFIPVPGQGTPGSAPGRIQLAMGNPPSGMTSVKADRTIEVEEGDTLTKLASEHLGTAGAWRKLLDANRDRLSRPEDLRAGMTLVLPAEARTAEASTQAATTTAATATRDAKPARSSQGGAYTIEPGDNLYRIAAKTLGDGNRWREIFDANKDRLKDPDTVIVGVKLRIPR